MKRYPGLDLLRAAAIIWVMLFHAWTEGLGTPLRPICTIGWMAVDLFFVLSGYLVGAQLFSAFTRGDPNPVRNFYARRMLRILPVYLTVLAAYEWLPFAREQPDLSPGWQFVTFTQNLLVDYQHNKAFSHAWSLCVEEHFYWFLPMLVTILLPLRSWKIVVGVCSGVFIFGFIYRWFGWSETLENGAIMRTQPYRFVEVIYYPTFARMDGILAGLCLALTKCFRPKFWSYAMAHPYWSLLGAAVVLAGAIHVAAPRTTAIASVFGFPLLALGFALLVASPASEHGLLGHVKVPGAQFFATITFSLYLSHKMTWHIVRTYFPELVPHGKFQALCVYASLAVGVGALLYFTIERTFLRLRDQNREVSRARPISMPAK